jgi:hypothetical protein
MGLPKGLVPSGFPTKTQCTALPSTIRATCPAHRILLDFTTRTILGKEYRSLSSSLCNFLHSPVTSSLLADRHKNENNDYLTTEVMIKIRMELKLGLRKSGKRNRVFGRHQCNMKCTIKINNVMLPQVLYSCDINVYELRQMMGMWEKYFEAHLSK